MGRTLLWLSYRLVAKVVPCDVTHMFWMDRDCSGLAPEPRGDFEFRLLTPEDVDRYCQDPANDTPEVFSRRCRSGIDHCFAALDGDRLAAYSWFARDSVEQEHNSGAWPSCGVAISFPPEIAFLYKGFVHPDYRGRRLYSAVMARALPALAPFGVRSVLSTADWTNFAALRNCAEAGFEDLGLVWKAGWGKHPFARIPRRARRISGTRFDLEAMVKSRDSLPLEAGDGASSASGEALETSLAATR